MLGLVVKDGNRNLLTTGFSQSILLIACKRSFRADDSSQRSDGSSQRSMVVMKTAEQKEGKIQPFGAAKIFKICSEIPGILDDLDDEIPCAID